LLILLLITNGLLIFNFSLDAALKSKVQLWSSGNLHLPQKTFSHLQLNRIIVFLLHFEQGILKYQLYLNIQFVNNQLLLKSQT